MKVLLDEPRVFVTYGSAVVFCGDDPDENDHDPDDTYAGQENGLCGAAVPGLLQLTVGTHTGWVPFRVELHTDAPAVDDSWDEIVEVSFRRTRKKVHLLGLDAEQPHRIELPAGDFRVRYGVRGFDETDAYLLQFWSAAPAADRILRRTSPQAAYWHRAHRGRPLPPAEQAAEDHVIAGEQERHLRRKYGQIPNARLQAVDAYTAGMVLIDRALVLALSEVDDDVLRRVARWSALRALSAAGLTDDGLLAPAVTALHSGQPLPAPFDDEYGWYSVVDKVTRQTFVPRLAALDGEPDDQERQQLYALSALGSLAIENPLAAVFSVVESTATALGPDDHRQFLTDLRTTFLPS